MRLSNFQPKEYLEVGERAATFLRKQLYDDERRRLHHSFRNGPSKAPGFLDDYAFLISGLLDLYECGGSIDWLAWAIQLQETQVKEIGRCKSRHPYILLNWLNIVDP